MSVVEAPPSIVPKISSGCCFDDADGGCAVEVVKRESAKASVECCEEGAVGLCAAVDDTLVKASELLVLDGSNIVGVGLDGLIDGEFDVEGVEITGCSFVPSPTDVASTCIPRLGLLLFIPANVLGLENALVSIPSSPWSREPNESPCRDPIINDFKGVPQSNNRFEDVYPTVNIATETIMVEMTSYTEHIVPPCVLSAYSNHWRFRFSGQCKAYFRWWYQFAGTHLNLC